MIVIRGPLRRNLSLLVVGALSSSLPLAARAATTVSAAATASSTDCTGPGLPIRLGISAGMLVLTCLWQMGISLVIAQLHHSPKVLHWCAQRSSRRTVAMLAGAALTALGLVGDILLWALLLRALNLFNSLETSFYFSAMTFTTVGYGDVLLPECWHLLGVGLALNGLLMAGWSTALLVYVVQHVLELRFNNRAPH
jgi:voltage-gated potassium channel Kch